MRSPRTKVLKMELALAINRRKEGGRTIDALIIYFPRITARYVIVAE